MEKKSDIKLSASQIAKNECLFSMNDVATYLNVSYDQVKNMTAARKLPYVVIGTRKRFFKRHLDTWLESKIVPVKKWN